MAHLRGSRGALQDSFAALSLVMRSGGFADRLDRELDDIFEQGKRCKRKARGNIRNKKTIIMYHNFGSCIAKD